MSRVLVGKVEALDPQAAKAMHKLHESADGIEEPIPGVEGQEGEEEGEGEERGKESEGEDEDEDEEDGGEMGLGGDADDSSGGGWGRRAWKRGRVIDDEEEEGAGDGQGTPGQEGAGREDQGSTPGDTQRESPRWLQPWERPGAGVCNICGEHGHWSYTCPRR